MTTPSLAIKIDVDTERGTRVGIPNLLTLLTKLQIPATFYLSLGPDNTGRAIKRIFRKGFVKKASRTNVITTYGIRTLLNGVLLPGPLIGKKHEKLLRSIKEQGFEVGIHAYDHQKWQDGITKMSEEEIMNLFQKGLDEFYRIFGMYLITAAAPGWQANEKTLAVYDKANLKYASDTRGVSPYYPKVGEKIYKTLQIPTTLPTLDELLGRPEYPLDNLIHLYLSFLKNGTINVLTVHAELEGMQYLDWFCSLLLTFKEHCVQFKNLSEIASRGDYLYCEMTQKEIDGRSGKLAWQSI
ncbi:MAG: 4-deoxy-4-formamido-L-arabinose-phosphoundecaprenol deformylase [Coxiellaceae bacterium]|jgi:peptidoglycan/xylan/chitin deacetylase (PgdA/CDA1 family)|nr:4-deoxy-4-formamido-L-arabinose-phosphoundecaprenol deformylase [Coxiellaceae bacterium]